MNKTAKINDLEIAYSESNNNGMPIFLVHGNSLSSDVFKEQFSSPILKNYRLIAPDLPGHGKSFRSAEPGHDYHLPNLITTLIKFINSFNFKEYFLYGNSLGGHLLINCLPYLNGVKGLAINGTPPLTSPPDMAACFLPNPAAMLAFKPDLSEEEINQLAATFCNPGSANISEIEEYIKNTDPEFRRVVGAGLISGKNNDEIEILKQSNIPLAIVHGENDSLINPAYFKNINLNLWNNKVHIIKNAGHLPFFENTEGFNEKFKGFLSAFP